MKDSNYFLKNMRLIDGTGNQPIEKAELLIKNERIASVGEKGSIDVPSDVKTFDLSGKTVIPGLHDSHLHLSGGRTGDPVFSRYLTSWETRRAIRAAEDARALIEAGYTSCRDAGGRVALGLRDAINEGTILGPRIQAAGRQINSTFGHIGRNPLPPRFYASDTAAMEICVDGIEECIKAVRTNLREGSDQIKICTGLWGESKTYLQGGCIPSFTVKEIAAMNYEAESMGFYIMTHANGYEGIMNALKAGVFSIEHGGNHMDEKEDKEIFRTMIKQNSIWAPTTAIVWKPVEYAKKAFGWTEKQIETWNENLFWALRTANEMGVRIASSTDYSGSGSIGGRSMGTNNSFNLELLVRAGLSPMDALVAATRRGAEAMRMEADLGTLETGKLADLVVLDGNPLEDIKILQTLEIIKLVMKDGEIAVNRM
jgi:imidazolonepropionase-like amidohydrolase